MRKTLRINLLLLMTALIGAGSCQRHYNRSREVEAAIRRRIPIGTPKSEVIATLDSLKDSLQIGRGAYNGTARTVAALAGNTSRSMITRGDLQMVFFFDENGILTQYQFKEVFTGP